MISKSFDEKNPMDTRVAFMLETEFEGKHYIASWAETVPKISTTPSSSFIGAGSIIILVLIGIALAIGGFFVGKRFAAKNQSKRYLDLN